MVAEMPILPGDEISVCPQESSTSGELFPATDSRWANLESAAVSVSSSFLRITSWGCSTSCVANWLTSSSGLMIPSTHSFGDFRDIKTRSRTALSSSCDRVKKRSSSIAAKWPTFLKKVTTNSKPTTCQFSVRCLVGSMASTARSVRRCTSSAHGKSPI